VLESRILEEKNRNATLVSYTSTISHEFRTPLATVLMFLEGLLQSTTDEGTRKILNLIIAQLNLLLCLVNDVLDIKTIEQGKFEQKNSSFVPHDTFEFIMAMFRPQATMQNTRIQFEAVSSATLD